MAHRRRGGHRLAQRASAERRPPPDLALAAVRISPREHPGRRMPRAREPMPRNDPWQQVGSSVHTGPLLIDIGLYSAAGRQRGLFYSHTFPGQVTGGRAQPENVAYLYVIINSAEQARPQPCRRLGIRSSWVECPGRCPGVTPQGCVSCKARALKSPSER